MSIGDAQFCIFLCKGFSASSFYGGHVVVYPSLHLLQSCTRQPNLTTSERGSFSPSLSNLQICWPNFVMHGAPQCTLEVSIWISISSLNLLDARFGPRISSWGAPFLQPKPMLLYIHVDPPVHGQRAEHSIAEQSRGGRA